MRGAEASLLIPETASRPGDMETSTLVRALCTVTFYITMFFAFSLSLICVVVEGALLLPVFFCKRGLRPHILGLTTHTILAYSAIVLRLFWGIKILRPAPPRKVVSAKKTIIMINHQSKLDPWVSSVCLLGIPTVYVIKRDLLKMPIAGWALRLSGVTVPISFTKSKGGWGVEPGVVQAVMKECLEVLDHGTALIVYPEGTRSVTGKLQPFKQGFFRLVADNPDIRILPIAIHNNSNIWPVKEKTMRPGTSYVMAGDFIYADGLTAEELCEKTHQAIFDLMKQSPVFDPVADQPLTQIAATRGHGF